MDNWGINNSIVADWLCGLSVAKIAKHNGVAITRVINVIRGYYND